MKLRELESRDPPDDLPFLREGDYSLLWISDFWDGPISGMLLHAGREQWFEMFRENDDDDSLDQWYRRYAVVALTAEQMAKEHEVHEDFRRYVGTYWDVGSPGVYRPEEEHHLFYDKHLEYCRTRRFDENEVIAWFER